MSSAKHGTFGRVLLPHGSVNGGTYELSLRDQALLEEIGRRDMRTNDSARLQAGQPAADRAALGNVIKRLLHDMRILAAAVAGTPEEMRAELKHSRYQHKVEADGLRLEVARANGEKWKALDACEQMSAQLTELERVMLRREVSLRYRRASRGDVDGLTAGVPIQRSLVERILEHQRMSARVEEEWDRDALGDLVEFHKARLRRGHEKKMVHLRERVRLPGEPK